ncbi:MAG: hypothetical protein AAF869_02990, partial [Pseudomonadota bacterium]
MTILGIDPSLIAGFYTSRLSQASVRTLPPSTTPTGGASLETDVEPPWGLDAPRVSEDRRLARALSGRPFVDTDLSRFEDASPDERNLFKLWVALDRLRAVAESAADTSTSELRLNSLDSRFQQGLAEILDAAREAEFTELQLTPGETRKRAEAEIAVQRDDFEYTTGGLVTTAFDDPVPGLTGTETFSAVIRRVSGEEVTVAFDLASVAGPLNLDNIVEYLNTELEAAGVVTRFDRVKIGEPDENDVIPGSTFGLSITGSSSETVRFEAAAAETAVYIAGVSGSGDDARGQFAKISNVDAAAPQVDFIRTQTTDAPPLAEAPTEFTPSAGGDDDSPPTFTTSATDEDGTPVRFVASARDSKGAVYVVGETEGEIDGLDVKGEQDVLLTKYDSTGQVLWTRRLGAASEASAAAIAVDADDNVVIAGSVRGDLSEGSIGGGEDSFVAKFSSAGTELWTYQRAPTADDSALGLSIGDSGQIYVTGRTKGQTAATQTFAGGTDGYVLGLSADGALAYARQFGGAGDERGVEVVETADGGIAVASIEDGRFIVTKYDGADADAAAIWRQDLGEAQNGGLGALVRDGNDLYLAGYTSNAALAGPIAQASGGDSDGFVAKLSDAGASASVDFVSYVGGASEDRIYDLTVENGRLFVAGASSGDIGADPLQGETDSFAAEISAAGATLWTSRFSGFSGVSRGFSVTADAAGSSVLDVLGLPRSEAIGLDDRSVTAQTNVRDGDFFYVSFDGGARRKVT